MGLRHAVFAAAVMLAAPAWAIEPSELTPEAATAMWCGAAFSIAAENLADAGDVAGADAQRVLAKAVLGKAYPLIQNGTLSRDDFRTLAERYADIVLEPFRAAEQTHTREECQSLAG